MKKKVEIKKGYYADEKECKCFHCKKKFKDSDKRTWGRMVEKGKYITKLPHYFHPNCWKEYFKKHGGDKVV